MTRRAPGAVEKWLLAAHKDALKAQLAEFRRRRGSYPPESTAAWRRWLRVREDVRATRRLLRRARRTK